MDDPVDQASHSLVFPRDLIEDSILHRSEQSDYWTNGMTMVRNGLVRTSDGESD